MPVRAQKIRCALFCSSSVNVCIYMECVAASNPLLEVGDGVCYIACADDGEHGGSSFEPHRGGEGAMASGEFATTGQGD